jgi:hypothetical protein
MPPLEITLCIAFVLFVSFVVERGVKAQGTRS